MKHSKLLRLSYCILLITICGVTSAGCGRYTEEVTNETINIFREYGDLLQNDILIDETGLLDQGRIYRDASCYRSINGGNYIAVSKTSGEMFVIDDINSVLTINKTLAVDKDISFTIDRIEIDNDWEDAEYPESGISVDGMTSYRNKGKVIVNDKYFFIHPQVTIFPDGTLRFEGGADPKSWILRRKNDDPSGSGFQIYKFDTCKWYKIDSDCIVFCENQYETKMSGTIMNIFDIMDEGLIESNDGYYLANFTTRNSIITELYIIDVE